MRDDIEANPGTQGSTALMPSSDRFEDQGEVAVGGLGVIRRAYDREMRRQVAMKSMHGDADASSRARFLEEVQIMACLDHPNVVPVYDVHRDAQGDVVRFSMKLVRGRTLAEIIAEQQSAPITGETLDELIGVFIKVCDAVAFAHSRGVIHCDLTPANVMVGSFGQVYVMDWGLAKAASSKSDLDTETTSGAFLPLRASDALDASGALVGTPAYMAPEQANCRPREIDTRTDVFLLGGILYSYLTLGPPLRGRDAVELMEKAKIAAVPPPEELVTDQPIPPGLSRITMRALARDPGDRFQNVSELRDAVAAFRRTGGWFAARTFAAGTIILNEGELGACSYFITDGTCEVYRVVHGEKRLLRTVRPGDVFGEVALFTGAPRSATVEAKTDVTVLEVTPDALDRELNRSEWLLPLAKAAAQRFRELDKSDEG